MTFSFVVLLTVLLQRVTLQGAWGETTPAQEALEFFSRLHPELLEGLEPKIRQQENADISTLVDSLSSLVDPKILSLLKASLYMRSFHPSALSRSEAKKQKNATMRGWGAISPPPVYREMGKAFPYKLIKKSLSKDSFAAKIYEMANLTEDIFQHWDEVECQQQENEKIVYSFYPERKEFSSVNGRVTQTDPHQVMNTILEEYETSIILKGLDISNRQFLQQRPGRDVHHFTNLLTEGPTLEHYDMWKLRGSWAKTLSFNKDYNSFLKYKDNLVDVQIFMRVGSKMAPALLDFAINAAETERPFKFHLFLFGNMSCLEEAKWVTCFWKVFDNVGARNGATFLAEAFNKGLKKAYKRTQSDVSWRKTDTLLNDEWIMRRANKTTKYCEDNGIGDWAVSINGEFLDDNPPFEFLMERCLLSAKRIQLGMKNGLDANKVSFPDWYASDAIIINSSHPPIDIALSNRISLKSKRPEVVVRALKELHQKCDFNQPSHLSVPVFTIGYELPSLNLNQSQYCTCSISATDTINEMFGDAGTIIGPFVFGRLSQDQIEYVINRVNYTYHHQLDQMSLIHRHFIELWRADASFRNEKRRAQPQINEKGIIRSRQTAVTWKIIMNPSLITICPMLELMKLLANCELVGIDFLPCPEAAAIDGVKPITSGIYHPAFTDDYVDIDTRGSIILRSYQWSLQYEKGTWTVLGVLFEGYVPSVDLIRIGDEVRAPFSNGYFATVLAPGKHETEGFEEPFISVNSLVSSPLIYKAGKISAQKPKDNNNVDIFTFCWNSYSFIRQKAMVYTCFTNLTTKSRLLLIDPWISLLHPNITTVFLPLYKPPDFPRIPSVLWFVKLAKYYYLGTILPSSSDKIIFADESIVFRGDASRLARINWKSGAVAAPLASQNNKGKPWDNWQMKSWTMGRPYHTTALIAINHKTWIEQHGSEHYLNMACIRAKARTTLGYGDDEYFNILQLHVQCITLPDTTAFCSANTNAKYSSTAFAHIRCEDKSEKLFGVRPLKLQDDANAYFNDL